jgi:hypothetical protein
VHLASRPKLSTFLINHLLDFTPLTTVGHATHHESLHYVIISLFLTSSILDTFRSTTYLATSNTIYMLYICFPRTEIAHPTTIKTAAKSLLYSQARRSAVDENDPFIQQDVFQCNVAALITTLRPQKYQKPRSLWLHTGWRKSHLMIVEKRKINSIERMYKFAVKHNILLSTYS